MTTDVKDAGGATRTVKNIDDLIAAFNANGRKAPSGGAPVTPVAAAAYLACPASTTTHLIKNGAGALGDYIEGLIIVVGAAATSLVQIKDGTSGNLMDVLPNNVGAGLGTYTVPLGLRATASDGWYVVTGAGSKAIAIGDF